MRDALVPLTAWVMTVALHASVLALAALLLERVLPRMSDAARELIWRVALLGGCLTASVQLGIGIDPLAGSWLALAPQPPAAAAAGLAAAPAVAAPGASAPAVAEVALHWREVAIAAWVTLAAVALAHLGCVLARLRRQLEPRTPDPVLQATAASVAATLGSGRAPRVTSSPHAGTPLALGLLRAEVCVPERARRELDTDELRAMLAHELAHVARRDPAWILLYAVVCRALFFHPLLWVARRRLLALAELRCDAIARATHRDAGVALARTLVRAAEWLAHAPRAFAAAHGHAMAATASGLHRRVRRLLDAPPRPSRAGSALARAGLLALSAGAPFVLPDVCARVAAPAVAAAPDAALPPAVATLARDLTVLRAEVDEVRALVARSALAEDAAIAAVLHEIDSRLSRLEARCAHVIDQFRSVPLPVDLR